jgi:WhiB family redox-sensing transcriptional regulator
MAQRECAECSVRTECLEYALVNRIEHGVWGGVSERERRRILQRRRRSVVAGSR